MVGVESLMSVIGAMGVFDVMHLLCVNIVAGQVHGVVVAMGVSSVL